MTAWRTLVWEPGCFIYTVFQTAAAEPCRGRDCKLCLLTIFGVPDFSNFVRYLSQFRMEIMVWHKKNRGVEEFTAKKYGLQRGDHRKARQCTD